jgi:O-antigen ligase
MAGAERSATVAVWRRLPDRAVMTWIALVLGGLLLSRSLSMPLAVIVVLAGVAVSIMSPVGAAAALMSAIPFVFHLLPIGGERFSPIELAIVVGCGGVAVRGAIMILRGEIRNFLALLLLPVETTVIATAVCAAGVVSLFFVADPHHLAESLRELRTVIIEPVAALLLLRWAIRHGGLPLLLFSLIGTGALIALDGMREAITRTGGVIGDQTFRAKGPYPHPNNLALYLERIALLAGGMALALGRWRSGLTVAAVLVGVGVAVTFSRGALLALVAGGALALLIVRPRWGWRIYGAAVVVGLALFALVAEGRLFATGSGGAESTRILIWRSSLRMAQDHPWTGVGLDQFYYQYMLRYVSPAGWPERYTSHPHNAILDVWLSLGVLGLMVFAALAALIGWRIVGLVRRSGPSSAIAVGAAVALVGGLAHGMVDNSFFLPDLAVLTWLLVALLDVGADPERTRSPRYAESMSRSILQRSRFSPNMKVDGASASRGDASPAAQNDEEAGKGRIHE